MRDALSLSLSLSLSVSLSVSLSRLDAVSLHALLPTHFADLKEGA